MIQLAVCLMDELLVQVRFAQMIPLASSTVCLTVTERQLATLTLTPAPYLQPPVELKSMSLEDYLEKTVIKHVISTRECKQQ